MKTKFFLIVIACLSLLFVGFVVPGPVRQEPQAAQQDEQLESFARKQFMRGKLESNQKIVEGLALKNYRLIREGAEGVTAIVKGQHWFVLDTPEYKAYSRDMETSAQRLADAAKDRNIEAAALRYFEVTLRCIDCHSYIEKHNQ